jgi:hypothetical protein
MFHIWNKQQSVAILHNNITLQLFKISYRRIPYCLLETCGSVEGVKMYTRLGYPFLISTTAWITAKLNSVNILILAKNKVFRKLILEYNTHSYFQSKISTKKGACCSDKYGDIYACHVGWWCLYCILPVKVRIFLFRLSLETEFWKGKWI